MTRSLLRRVAPWRPSWQPPAASLLDELRAEIGGGRALQLDAI